MPKYLEIPIEDKTVLVDITPRSGWVEAGGDVIEKAQGKFDQVMETVRSCAVSFCKGLNQLEGIIPQEATLEFGVAFNAEASAVVSKVSAEGNFKITLTWKEPSVDQR